MRPASLFPTTLLFLAACPGPDRNATLADLPGLRVSVSTSSASDREPTRARVVIRYDEDAFKASHEQHCATLGRELRGELDGDALEPTSYGSDEQDFDFCDLPQLEVERREAGDTRSVLTITDDSLTVRAELPVGALAPRQPTLRFPGAWRFTGGQEVRVGWSHPADLTEAPLDPRSVYFHTGDPGPVAPGGVGYVPLPARVDGDELRFTIPSPPPLTGPGLIVFSLGDTVGSAQTCTGATACEYSASRSFSHSVEIAR